MKRIFTLAFCFLSIATNTQAQSKVFKEVNDEISTSMQTITQDGALVGYLVFTQLEQVNEDSFSYKITIMDENLNDIGEVKFRDEKLRLEKVSFEQDVLCVSYFKSNIIDKEFKNLKAFKEAKSSMKNSVFLQFLNLEGKILKTNNLKVNVSIDSYTFSNSRVAARLTSKIPIHIGNISQKGFVCLYADNNENQLRIFSSTGEELWKKKLTKNPWFYMITSQDDIYILSKKGDTIFGGYSISSYGFIDSTEHLKNYPLRDKKGNMLSMVNCENDPVTGKPTILGFILKTKKRMYDGRAKKLYRGGFCGVFTLDFKGRDAKDIKENFAYWDDESMMPAITKTGKFLENSAVMSPSLGFRDFQGNSYFVGSVLTRKPRWGIIGVGFVALPTIIVPLWLISTPGYTKYKMKDASIIKLDTKGTLSFENNIAGNKSIGSLDWVEYLDNKKYFSVSNSTTKSNYVVIDDMKDIVIYNVNQKKTVKTISHKEGKSTINVYPAKEGHILVSEYNKKEKYTRFSIEAL